MQFSRATTLSLTCLHLVCVIAAISYCQDKRPVFMYTTQMSTHDAIQAFNWSHPLENVNFWLRHHFDQGTYREDTVGVYNPYVPILVPQKEDSSVINNDTSFVQITPLSPFSLFIPSALLTICFSFITVRIVENGNINCDAVYGEHGLSESLGWELLFWCYTWFQHGVVVSIMSSPVDAIYVVFESFVVTVLIAAFCFINLNTGTDNPSRRLEAPVLILLCLCYLLLVTNSKIVFSVYATYSIWLIFHGLDMLMIVGHIWDDTVSCATIVNCRWAYVVICGYMNVILYILY